MSRSKKNDKKKQVFAVYDADSEELNFVCTDKEGVIKEGCRSMFCDKFGRKLFSGSVFRVSEPDITAPLYWL